ncbi:MAG: hypothetical protein WCR20_15035 [Verrucomicrobiota bacterium]
MNIPPNANPYSDFRFYHRRRDWFADYFHGMGFARGTSYTQPADDIGLAALRSFQLPVLGRSSRKVPFAGHCTRFRRVLESDLFG